MFIVIMLLLYGVLLGYIMSRLPKMDRQLIHRALMAQPLSQDPLMAKRERRLIKAMEVIE